MAKKISTGKKAVSKKKTIAKKPVAAKAVTVYHKPNCSTSRTVVDYLKKKKVEVDIIKYMDDRLTEKDLEKLLAKLHIKPFDLVRTKEAYYKEKLKGLNLNDHEWVREMVENPNLIQRPILVKGNKAIIGRPIENVDDFLKKI